jgi:hypothetical protein
LAGNFFWKVYLGISRRYFVDCVEIFIEFLEKLGGFNSEGIVELDILLLDFFGDLVFIDHHHVLEQLL